MTSHRIASHRIASHHNTTHHITSHHITAHHTRTHIASQHTTPHHIIPHHITSHHITLWYGLWNIVVQCQHQDCPLTFIVSRNQQGSLNIYLATSTLRFLALADLNSAMQTLHSLHCIALFTSIKFSECNNFYDLCCSIFVFMIYSL